MFTTLNIIKKSSSISSIILQARHKSKTHWAKLRRKNSPKDKALSHFDDFYGNVFGEKWQPIRESLLRRSKYVAVVNNYGDVEETLELLTNRGAHCLKKLMQVQKEFQDQYDPPPVQTQTTDSFSRMNEFAKKLINDEMANVYPQVDMDERLSTNEKEQNSEENVKMNNGLQSKSLQDSVSEAEIHTSRIIDPSMGLTSEALYQYVPATKLKGMEDWVPESQHYSYYSNQSDKDFPLIIEPETEFEFPEHLKVYTYEMDSEWDKFPEPKRGKTGVFNYYPMDCGSVLAVLALCLRGGDRVLDLCSAPGGKALVALQTLLPDILVCNDISISRNNRLRHILNNYLYDFETSNLWRERLFTTRVDGTKYRDDQGFDKVLVDVPCTTDRHSVTKVEDNNLFRPDRIKERLKLPELQAQLLANALKLVKPGGAVVYSTCSLSPVQNDGVVHMALKQAFETRNIVASIRDLTTAMAPLSSTMTLAAGSVAPRYGQLVLPSLAANFGPSYVARLVRLK